MSIDYSVHCWNCLIFIGLEEWFKALTYDIQMKRWWSIFNGDIYLSFSEICQLIELIEGTANFKLLGSNYSCIHLVRREIPRKQVTRVCVKVNNIGKGPLVASQWDHLFTSCQNCFVAMILLHYVAPLQLRANLQGLDKKFNYSNIAAGHQHC